MFPSRRAGSLAVAAALLAGLSASLASAAPGPKFVFAATGYYRIDPAFVTTPLEERVALACFEGLFRFDPSTGEVVPGACEKHAVSTDGKEWTFTIRADARWAKRVDGKAQEIGPLTAKDFMDSWLRLLDPEDTKSPNAHVLDVIPEAKVYSTEYTRAVRLGEIAAELKDLLGTNKGISGEDVFTFVSDVDRACRLWCGDVKNADIQAFLAWKPKDAMEPAKVKKIAAALEAASKTANDTYQETKTRLKAGQGFVAAKDGRTLVVRTPGYSPWLPSLLARAPLVPVHVATVEKSRRSAFEKYSFVGNGAYLPSGESTERERPDSTEPQYFKVVLEKNPLWWNAASVPSDRIEGHIDQSGDEVLRRYGLGEIAWATADAFGPEFKKIRAAKAGGAATGDVQKAAPDFYETAVGSVCVLRFRCDRAPCDKLEVRRGLAALIDRAAIAKAMGAGAPPPAARFVPARTKGASASVPTPSWPAGDAKKMIGSAKLFDEGSWFILLCSNKASHDAASRVIGDRWRKELGFETSPSTAEEEDLPGTEDDLPGRLRAGSFHAAISTWRAGYDDPLAFLAAFTTGNVEGSTGWSNAAYDALVKGAIDPAGFAVAAPNPALKDLAEVKNLADRAKASPSPETWDALRLRLCHEAEAILLAEAVVVPLWFPVESGVVRPKTRGLSLSTPTRSILDVHTLTGASAE